MNTTIGNFTEETGIEALRAELAEREKYYLNYKEQSIQKQIPPKHDRVHATKITNTKIFYWCDDCDEEHSHGNSAPENNKFYSRIETRGKHCPPKVGNPPQNSEVAIVIDTWGSDENCPTHIARKVKVKVIRKN